MIHTYVAGVWPLVTVGSFPTIRCKLINSGFDALSQLSELLPAVWILLSVHQSADGVTFRFD